MAATTQTIQNRVVISAQRLAELRHRSQLQQQSEKAKQLQNTQRPQSLTTDQAKEIYTNTSSNQTKIDASDGSQKLSNDVQLKEEQENESENQKSPHTRKAAEEYIIVPNRLAETYSITYASGRGGSTTNLRDPEGNLIGNDMYRLSDSESSDADYQDQGEEGEDDDGEESDINDMETTQSLQISEIGPRTGAQNTSQSYPTLAGRSARLLPGQLSNSDKKSHVFSLRQRVDRLREKYHREKIIKEVQPGNYFAHPVETKFLGAQQLDAEGHPPYMNNVAASSAHYPMFFLADRAAVRVYANDVPSGVLEDSAMLYIPTQPDVTTEAMREAAVYPTDPHNITRLITGTVDNGGTEILVAACDSGRVVVYKTSKLFKYFEKALELAQKNNKTPDIRGTMHLKKLRPDAVYQLPMSAWGLDIHPTKNLVAVACNEGRVYTYEISGVLDDQRDDETTVSERLVGISPQLPHNVPDVKFVFPCEEDVKKGLYLEDAFYIMCCSISGHVAMWEFYTGDRLQNFLTELVDIDEGNITRTQDTNHLSKLVMKERQNIQKLQKQQQNPNIHKRPSSSGINSFTGSRMNSTSGTERPQQRSRTPSAIYSNPNGIISLSDLIADDPRILSPLDPSFSPTLTFGGTNEDDAWDGFAAFEADATETLNSYRWLFPGEQNDPWFLRIPFRSGNQGETEGRSGDQFGGRWMVVEQLRQDGWSLNMLQDEDFLAVDNLYEISGNKWFNETNVVKQQSSSMHKQYNIPGLNREIQAKENEDSEKQGSIGSAGSMGPFGLPGATGASKHGSVGNGPGNSKCLGELIPLNQDFIDFAMQFSFFTIYTVPVLRFDQSWKYYSSAMYNGGRSYSNSSANGSSMSLASRTSFSLNPTSTGDGGELGARVSSRGSQSGNGIADFRARIDLQNQTEAGQSQSQNRRVRNSVFEEEEEEEEEGEEENIRPNSSSTEFGGVRSDMSDHSIGAGAIGFFDSYTGTSAAHSSTYLDTIRVSQRDAYIYKRTQHPGASSYTHSLLRDPPLRNQFTFMTSTKSVHLCRAESLIGNASQGDVFECISYLDRASASFDRLSITARMPGLNAIVVASQLGAVSVFRLVKYKQVYAVRQEYVLPVHEMFVHRRSMRRAIVGLAAVPVYGSSQPRINRNGKSGGREVKKYRLIVTYLDGFMLSYELSDLNGVMKVCAF